MNAMDLFGFIMLLCTIQLLVVGSIIQRGKASWLPETMKKDVDNMPMFCRYIGNRIILLGLISAACSWISFHKETVSMQPVIIFGAGVCLVIVLMFLDRKKFTRKM